MTKKYVFDGADRRVTENPPGYFTVRSSVLGLEKGVWPMKIETELGNAQPLSQAKSSWDGKIFYVVYKQVDGPITLKVISDYD